MIKGTRKVIKIGSSHGFTIPSNQLKELNVVVGDKVEYEIRSKKTSKVTKHEKLLEDLEDFMNTYDQDLTNLANR